MRCFVFGLFKDKVQQSQRGSLEADRSSDDSYMDEYKRLENLREDSENIWEERGYIE